MNLRNMYSMYTYVLTSGSFVVLQKKTSEFTVCKSLPEKIEIDQEMQYTIP